MSLDLELPQRRVASIAARHGVRWLDLLPTFRREYRGDLYYGTDPHWTKAGHALAGRELGAALGELLESPPADSPR